MEIELRERFEEAKVAGNDVESTRFTDMIDVIIWVEPVLGKVKKVDLTLVGKLDGLPCSELEPLDR